MLPKDYEIGNKKFVQQSPRKQNSKSDKESRNKEASLGMPEITVNEDESQDSSDH